MCLCSHQSLDVKAIREPEDVKAHVAADGLGGFGGKQHLKIKVN